MGKVKRGPRDGKEPTWEVHAQSGEALFWTQGPKVTTTEKALEFFKGIGVWRSSYILVYLGKLPRKGKA